MYRDKSLPKNPKLPHLLGEEVLSQPGRVGQTVQLEYFGVRISHSTGGEGNDPWATVPLGDRRPHQQGKVASAGRFQRGGASPSGGRAPRRTAFGCEVKKKTMGLVSRAVA